jgi:uncharacterized protein
LVLLVVGSLKTQRKLHLKDGSFGAAIKVKITPRASRDEIIGILDDGTVKIRITAPPVEGQANQALVEFLARKLDVGTSKIEIISGHTGRDKLVMVIGLEPEVVNERLINI